MEREELSHLLAAGDSLRAVDHALHCAMGASDFARSAPCASVYVLQAGDGEKEGDP